MEKKLNDYLNKNPEANIEWYENYKLKREWIKEICEMVEPLNVNPYMYHHGAIMALHYSEEIKASAIRNEKELIVAKAFSIHASIIGKV